MYVGIDFHKKNTYVTRMDQQGVITESINLKNELGNLEKFVNTIEPEDHVVLEATGNWQHFYELVEDKALDITLSHPAKTRAIASAKIKTDKIDSEMLAHLLRADLIPVAYIPSRETRDLKEVLRYRASLVSVRTSIKNKVHAILSKNGIICPYSDVFGKKSLLWLATLPVRACYRTSLDGYLAVAGTLSFEITKIDEDIHEMAKASDDARLLMTMPGISFYSALLILSEIGDINRFPSSGHLASYAGLVPSVYSSGGKTRMGRITKTGSKYLRWVLVENSHHAIRGTRRFEDLYGRVVVRSGKNAAKTAVARKMLVSIFNMLTKHEVFQDIQEVNHGQGAGERAEVIASPRSS